MGKVIHLHRGPISTLPDVVHQRYARRKGRLIFDRQSALVMLRMRSHLTSARDRQAIMQQAHRFAPEAVNQARVEDRMHSKTQLKK